MSFGTRLRDKRNELNITQPQLAKMLGVSQSAVGSWETGVNSPRATLLYNLFDILHCDANYLFQDETRELYKNEASPEEFEELILPYRNLDARGQRIVKMILKNETERIIEFKHLTEKISDLEIETAKNSNIKFMANAAHKRTDIPESELTPEMQQIDEDIMDDENF